MLDRKSMNSPPQASIYSFFPLENKSYFLKTLTSHHENLESSGSFHCSTRKYSSESNTSLIDMHIDMPSISNENNNFVMIFDELDKAHHDKVLQGRN